MDDDPQPRGIPGQVALRGVAPSPTALFFAPWAILDVWPRPGGGARIRADWGGDVAIREDDVENTPDEVRQLVHDAAPHWPGREVHV